MNSGLIFTGPRKQRGKYSQSHYSPRLKRIMVLVYTHEVISTKSGKKPLKSTIWLTDQITLKFKNRSLQNFQTWQFTSLSFRKQQRNGLNGTAKTEFELFPYLRRKVELCHFRLTRQVYSQKGSLCRSSHEVLIKMAAWLLEVRCHLPVSFFFLFTWNVQFLQTFPFKFVCHK